ncbi:MAG TPA: hypothetical protein DEH05_05605 [Propionibacteriaceae bacterium]|nr:hypothetical protein [Propionibacteriaceae bacterium]
MSAGAPLRPPRRVIEARCPLRPADKCSLCFPGASGPQDCGLVYLAMDDPELREDWLARRGDVGPD